MLGRLLSDPLFLGGIALLAFGLAMRLGLRWAQRRRELETEARAKALVELAASRGKVRALRPPGDADPADPRDGARAVGGVGADKDEGSKRIAGDGADEESGER